MGDRTTQALSDVDVTLSRILDAVLWLEDIESKDKIVDLVWRAREQLLPVCCALDEVGG